ncbi:MAG: hypothetical protein ACLR23_08625 [Clostridia bacterium]
MNYQSILILRDNMQTDLTLQDLTTLVLSYRQCAESISQYDTLPGVGKTIDGSGIGFPMRRRFLNFL